MKYKVLINLLSLINLYGAFDLLPVNNAGQGAGMSLSFNNLSPSFLFDPAAIPIFYGIKIFTTQWHPWGLSNIRIYEIRSATALNQFGLGIGINNLNHSLYQEQTSYFSIAKRLSKRATVGLSLIKQKLWIQGHGQISKNGFSLALKNNFSEYFDWGVSIFSVDRNRNKKKPRIFHFALINAIRIKHANSSVQLELKSGDYLFSVHGINISYKVFPGVDLGITSLDKTRQTLLSAFIKVENFYVTLSAFHSMYLAKYTYQVGLGFSFVSNSSPNNSISRAGLFRP